MRNKNNVYTKLLNFITTILMTINFKKTHTITSLIIDRKQNCIIMIITKQHILTEHFLL